MLVNLLASCQQSSITIVSEESKTPSGAEVINTIELKQSKKLDIWTMKQSHGSSNFKQGIHDDLKIIVNKSHSPYSVTYHQMRKGVQDFSVQCTLCHSNGPRMIRANQRSNDSLSLGNKIKLIYWNLIIKSYGRIKTIDSNNNLTFKGNAKDFLNIKTCNTCHNQNGTFLSRNRLQRGNFLAIKHLTDNKKMPPWPYSLSKKEKYELERFLKGSKL